MKRFKTLFILILTLAVSVVAFGACVPGVSEESDMYGSFFIVSDELGDNTRCVTLKADNVGVVEYGNTSESYYARYDLTAGTIEFRVDDYRGEVKYTFTITDIDTLTTTATFTEDDGTVADEVTLTFVRDRAYDPAD